ncbi:Calx-beta domain-containing protein [Phytohabitans sp. ZYX-F-186]|uniref:Calx-beta domain-containing protein n=1 Tax=Phytohabitans maris TaxID=3071409 RepID=A0ABU0ZFP8_9ACTN|nr:Calx-beta domain-containing protein [Phytohabitans sp. ZYX-F-186]MDQ7904777.1 Calx-beta domain-containing protein [Phytohabitans sp. ZYX-F-186]
MATLLAGCLASSGWALVPARAAAADPGVEPSNVTLTLGPGGSADVTKVVHTPPIPPNPDLVFIADTTGSMGGAIANVRTNAADILSEVSGAQPTAQFAVAEYKDFTDSSPFRVNQGLTGDDPAVQAGIDQWVASGGGDFPEANLNALYEVATGAIAFRPDSTRIAVIFGDAPSHDPSGGHTLADTSAALQAAGIRLVAVDVGALDSSGQFSNLTAATGGVLLSGVAGDEVADAILAGIKAIEVTVTPKVVSCAAGVSVTFSPANRTVTSGEDATFTEHVALSGSVPAGAHQCTVDFLVDGESRGFIQKLTVNVPGLKINDVEVPEPGGPAVFTVTRTGPTDNPVTVKYATANGSATAPGDYTAVNGTLTFAAGETTKPLPVPIKDDAVNEPDETFAVNLSAPTGAAIVDGAGVGKILDNERDGSFSCQATAVKIASLKAAQANPADVPCADDAATVAQSTLNAGIVKVQTSVLDARTDQTPNNLNSAPPAAGDSATAKAGIDSTKIIAGPVVIELGVIKSSASATCTAGPAGLTPKFAGASSIASLKINGLPVTVGTAPLTIPLVVGSLQINSTQTTGNTVVQRAVFLDTLLTDVVLAESKANVEGKPCEA